MDMTILPWIRLKDELFVKDDHSTYKDKTSK